MDDALKCDQCGAGDDLFIMSADEGHGAWLRVLCGVCCHRVRYRMDLRARLAAKKEASLE